MIDEPGCMAGRLISFKTAARPGRHPAQIVADLGDLHRRPFHGGRHLGEGTGVLGGLHQVAGPAQGKAADFGQFWVTRSAYPGRAVDAGADGRGAHVDVVKFVFGTLAGRRHGALDHDGIGLNSWPRVMGTASWFSVRPILSTSENSSAFGLQGRLQLVHGAQQILERQQHGQLDGRG
jgi:hypothetical protein